MRPNCIQIKLFSLVRSICSRFRFRGMYPLLRLLANPDEGYDYEFEVYLYENRYKGNLNDHIDWHAYFYGAYEKPLLDFMRAYVVDVKECVFLDVGGNTGHHSLAMAYVCKQVHAFEPYKDLWGTFESRIEHNKITNIRLHRCALGDRQEVKKYYPPNTNNRGQGSFIRSNSATNNGEAIQIEVKNADKYLVAEGISKIDVIKIDVEGYEPNVLKGLNYTIKNNSPLIILEISAENKNKFASKEKLLKYIPAEYELYYLKRKGFFFCRYGRELLSEEKFRNYVGNVICYPPMC